MLQYQDSHPCTLKLTQSSWKMSIYSWFNYEVIYFESVNEAPWTAAKHVEKKTQPFCSLRPFNIIFKESLVFNDCFCFRTPAPPEGVELPRPYGFTKRPSSEPSLVDRVGTKYWQPVVKNNKTQSIPHSFVSYSHVKRVFKNLIVTLKSTWVCVDYHRQHSHPSYLSQVCVHLYQCQWYGSENDQEM